MASQRLTTLWRPNLSVLPMPRIESSGLSERYPPAVKVHLDAALIQCTLDLAGSKRALRQAVAKRKAAKTALKESKRVSSLLLKESSLAEERLRTAVRKILTENEDERKNMSLRLHDEIVQNHLAIQVRMLALSKAAASNTGLTEEITSIQRLVEESARTTKRVAREFGMRHDD